MRSNNVTRQVNFSRTKIYGKCDILADFQTAFWSVVKLGLLLLRLLQDETGLGGCSSTSTEKRERLKHRCYNPLAHIRKMKAQVMPKAKLTKNILFVNPGVILESRLWINNCPFRAFLMRQFECNTTFNRRGSIHFRKQSFIAF